MNRLRTVFPALLCLLALLSSARGEDVIVGDIRVQTLSPRLVRIERRGPLGFEDRETFLVVERSWPGVPARIRKGEDGRTVVSTQHYAVLLPVDASSLEGIEIRSPSGELLYRVGSDLPAGPRFPAPNDMGPAFAAADSPRIIPPPWGAAPPPEDALPPEDPLYPTSGWVLGNDAPDVYVFINRPADYRAVRREFLRLTGPIPLPPLFVLGFWDSRYHPYTEKEALAVIDRYRADGIPLDVFVVDTNWRVGGSHGYDIAEDLFPDMSRFLREAHRRNVRLMFNDHPEPLEHARGQLDPVELRYRWNGLTRLLSLGIDFWWFDRNWPGIIPGPVKGIDREVWGQRLFTDIHARFRPRKRPVIMSMRSNHPASHRYPIWWTGDIHSTFDALRQGVRDSVSDGIRLLPWVNQDLGGHTGDPSTELYLRFVEWGCLSPVTRLHCTLGRVRYPWAYGDEAEDIVREYVRMRYRLLPTLYAAARRSFEDGTPLLRRCDLEWPDFPEAQDDLQYLLADDILVAPVVRGSERRIPPGLLRDPDGNPGLRGEYFDNEKLEGPPALVRTDPEIDFRWKMDPPAEGLPAEGFSVRWTGTLGPIPETGVYDLAVASDDGSRLWIGDRLVVDNWGQHPEVRANGSIRLEEGATYPIRIEYYDWYWDAVCRLDWTPPGAGASVRRLWLPPGEWEDAWTGRILRGPARIEVEAPVRLTPIFVRRGGIVLGIPQVFHTGQRPWTRVIVDAYPARSDAAVERVLYEDDGETQDYLRGLFLKTRVTMRRDPENVVTLTLHPATGSFPGRPRERSWVIRVHLEPGERPGAVRLNGESIQPDDGARAAPRYRILPPATPPGEGGRLPMPFGGEGAPPPPEAGSIVEIRLPAVPIGIEQRIRIVLDGKNG